MLRIVLIVHCALNASVSFASEIAGIVTEVLDGDSLIIVADKIKYRIRLTDIDAPEMKQAHGRDARMSLFALCGLRRATADISGKDLFGRALARVSCGGINANAEQVRRGWAWVFRRYASKHTPLYLLEEEARKARRGLWEDLEPMPPWDWRHLKRKGEVSARDLRVGARASVLSFNY